MALSDQQRLSIENSFESLARSTSHPAAATLRTELAARRWGGDAVVVGSVGIKTLKVLKDKRRAKVEAQVEYTTVRDRAEGGGRSDDTVKASFSVSVDDIDAAKPQATGFTLKHAEGWKT